MGVLRLGIIGAPSINESIGYRCEAFASQLWIIGELSLNDCD
jgi:hypothetical protein